MNRILLGNGEQAVFLRAQYGNRHGLVAGAAGTGRTVSPIVIAEGFSRIGVPVFIPDVKGDVAGLALPVTGSEESSSERRRPALKDTRRKPTSCSDSAWNAWRNYWW